MNPIPIFQKKLTGSEMAFAVLMLASFVVYAAGWGPGLRAAEIMRVILLSLIYLAIGIYGERLLLEYPPGPLRIVYFLFQLALGGAIIYFTRGLAWLVLLPMASTALELFSSPAALGMTALIWVVQIAPLYWLFGMAAVWSNGPILLAALVFVLAFTQLTRREQQARLELAEAHEQLREYAARVEELAMTRERNRLAREIHDGLGHYLTAINVQIRAAQARLDQDPELSREALSKAQQMTQEALADVRSSISALRADPTSSRPLEETIRLLLADVRATGLQTRLTVNGEPRSLPQEVEFACFRMVQEGLTNVCKHAQAKRVDLHLEFLEDSVRIRLQDDGKGADSPAGGFGLLGLRERCEMLGGSLNIATRPGEGFMLTMEVPG